LPPPRQLAKPAPQIGEVVWQIWLLIQLDDCRCATLLRRAFEVVALGVAVRLTPVKFEIGASVVKQRPETQPKKLASSAMAVLSWLVIHGCFL
jgi:hypothetical protein